MWDHAQKIIKKKHGCTNPLLLRPKRLLKNQNEVVTWISTRLQDGHAWSQMVFCTIWVSTRAVLSSCCISVDSNQSAYFDLGTLNALFFHTTAACWIIVSFWAILCETKKLWLCKLENSSSAAESACQSSIPARLVTHTHINHVYSQIKLFPSPLWCWLWTYVCTDPVLTCCHWLADYIFLQQAAELYIQIKWTLCECKIS